MDERQVLDFIARLRKAQNFEDGALVLLREALDVTKAVLKGTRYEKRSRILRGMAHLRPADGYQRLVILDDTASKVNTGTPYVPSAGAWRWVVKYESPIAIDVPLGRVQTCRNHTAQVVVDGGASNHDSMLRLSSREVSHLYAVPLRSWRGTIEGMATVEIECPTAVGQEFIFAAVAGTFELLADIAVPYLANLPLRQSAAAETDALLPVVGPTMAGLVQMLRVFAQQEETLLIGGPTGAGKSRIARWCHQQSPRSGRKFEVLDLNTVPEELQMAELFGWRKGAFTNAVRDTPGSIARAHEGTLFIDEIDKLSLKAQAGLLHLLEERTYRPLGDRGPEQRADVRFIVGTNVDLYTLVRENRFREDLYYRINVLPIRLPSLADRRDEIPAWTRYLATRRHREVVPKGDACISAAAERLLIEHEWPGNLRQLDNVVRRAYTLALMAHGTPTGDVVLEEPHFLRALSYERGGGRRAVLESMRIAATAFVEEAERIKERNGTLDMDLCDAFRGIVLGVAVKRFGDRDEAFRLMGKAAQVQSRNHHKMLRRELEKVDTLCRSLGEQEGSMFPGLRDDDS